MDHPKILSEKPILTADLFQVNEVEIQFPVGKKVWRNVHVRDVAIVFPITDDGEIFLIQQYRYALKKVSTEVVAGYVESGENPLDTAVRELKEEAGIAARKVIPLATLQLGTTAVTGTRHLYYATGLTLGTTKFDDTEDIKLLKVSFNEAVKRIFNGDIDQSTVVSGILMLDKMRQEGKIQF